MKQWLERRENNKINFTKQEVKGEKASANKFQTNRYVKYVFGVKWSLERKAELIFSKCETVTSEGEEK